MYLGINGHSHDASAALIDEKGNIIVAVEEERFTGIKHESKFPVQSIKFCLEKAGITTKELRGVGYSWSPSKLLFSRIMWSNLIDYPVSFKIIRKNLTKLRRTLSIKKKFEELVGPLSDGISISYFKHHESHTASAFYASPFNNAAFLTLDGRGELETGTWGTVNQTEISKMGYINFPNSLGNLYVAIGHFCGYPTFHKAGTVMALAAFGTPKYQEEFKRLISIDLSKDSNFFTINREYIDCSTGDGVPKKEMEILFNIQILPQGSEPTQKHKDIAATLQFVVQNFIIDLLNKIQKETGQENIVMSGGVCLNSVTNGMIREKTTFKDFFIQPAAHDAGLSIGSAYLMLYKNKTSKGSHEMKTACLGPSYTDGEIESFLKENNSVSFKKVESIEKEVARLINDGKKIAWFQGRMEFGPRALGCRSILADARNANIVSELNKIKSREAFRPFAISILEEKATEWLIRGTRSPFMLLVDYVKKNLKDKVPAAQHVDGSVRVQTVNKKDNGIYYNLINEFYKLTNVPMVINTSFNIKGLPIARTPDDAIKAFIAVKLDVLAMGNFIITKNI